MSRATTPINFFLAMITMLIVILALGPITGQWQVAPVISPSMEPRLSVGSLVMSRPVDLADIQIGDVAVFEAPIDDRALTVHRIVGTEWSGDRLMIRTKGDANSNDDPWTATIAGDRVWRVEGSVPRLGRALLFFVRLSCG